MNIKFLPREDTKFDIGAKWDQNTTEILGVTQFGTGMWDYMVRYRQIDGTVHEKDIWNFQIKHVP